MRIHRLRIHNILGIDELEFEAGQFNLITGGNASGKTSVIQALLALSEGGYDATLLRKGAEEGEVVILLTDDDGHELEARKRITQAGASLQVRIDDQASTKPQKLINKLIDSVTANPLSFLLAPPAKRAEILLETLPLDLDVEEVVAATGNKFRPHSTQPLDMLAEAHQEIYDRRTGVNRAAKEKRATAEQIRKGLPPDDGTDLAAGRAGLAEARRKFKAEYDQALKEMDTVRDQAIAKINLQYEQAVEALHKERLNQMANVQTIRDSEWQKLQTTAGPKFTALEMGEERLRQIEKSAETRVFCARLEKEATKLEEEASDLTSNLERLERLRRETPS